MFSQSFAGRHQHLIGNARGARGDHPQANPREDVGVVALGDGVGFILPHDRRERAAGSDQRIALGPGDDVLRGGFHAGGRVRQRHHDRTRAVFMHLADDLFGEQAGLPGDADQNVRLHVAHHIQQGQHFVVGIPVFQILAFLHQFGLERQQVRHGISQQAEAIHHKDARAGQLFA